MTYPLGHNTEEYSSGYCPKDFPVILPTLFFEVLYDTTEWEHSDLYELGERPYNPLNPGKSPFVLSNGDTSGFSLHGDFINGWDLEKLQQGLEQCNGGQPAAGGECSGLGKIQSRAEALACRIPKIINEETDVQMHKLPGCNPIYFGHERQEPQFCNGSGIGNPVQPYTDVSQEGWRYIGCGKEQPNDAEPKRAFTGASTTYDEQMTVQRCIDFCDNGGGGVKSASFEYAGLQFGRECWCGDELNRANEPDPSVMGDCTMECTGNHTQICGGDRMISMYKKCRQGDQCRNVEYDEHGGSRGGY
jgi:hypothetical protein